MAFLAMELRKDGLFSWLICFASFLITVCTVGFQFSFGLIFTALIEEYGESRSKTALIGSLPSSLMCVLSPFTMIIARQFGFIKVMIFGGVLFPLSLVFSSFTTNVDQMIITFGLMLGVASSCMMPFLLIIMSYIFDKRLSTAMGFSTGGASLGPLVFTPILSVSITQIGWRKSFQVLAVAFVIILVMCIMSFLLIPEVRKPQNHGQSVKKSLETLVVVVKNAPTMVLIIAVGITCLQYVVSHTHMIQYALEYGIPKSKAVTIPTIMSVGSTIGRFISGPFFDLNLLNPVLLYQCLLFTTAVSAHLGLLTKSYSALAVYFFFHSVFDGAQLAQQFKVLHEIVPNDAILYEALQLLIFSEGINIVIGPPLVGLIVDHIQDYSSVFYVMGAPLFIGGLLIFFVRYSKGKADKKKQFLLDIKPEKSYDKEDDTIEKTDVLIGKETPV